MGLDAWYKITPNLSRHPDDFDIYVYMYIYIYNISITFMCYKQPLDKQNYFNSEIIRKYMYILINI